MFRNGLLATLVFSLPSLAFADLSTARVNELMQYSAINDGISQVGDALASGLNNNRLLKAMLTEHGVKELAKEAKVELSPTAFQKSVATSVSRELSDTEYTQLMAWYQSSLGKRVSNYEVTRMNAKGAQKIAMREHPKLLAAATQERIQLLEKLDKLSRATEMTNEVAKVVATDTWTAEAKAQGTYTDKSKKLFDSYLALRLAQAELLFKKENQASYLYTYQPMTDKELKQYVDFLDTPAAQEFVEAANVGFMRTIESGSKSFGNSVARLTLIADKSQQN